jgi:hypothetical protein
LSLLAIVVTGYIAISDFGAAGSSYAFNQMFVNDPMAMLLKLDELVSLADEIPVSNALPSTKTPPVLERQAQESLPGWWGRDAARWRRRCSGWIRL